MGKEYTKDASEYGQLLIANAIRSLSGDSPNEINGEYSRDASEYGQSVIAEAIAGLQIQSEIPIASANTLGGIKVGENLSIDSSGVLSSQAVSVVDPTITEDSQNPVTSSAIYSALQNISDTDGNSKGMVEDVLFSNSDGVNSGTINLSGNISDYDLIVFSLRTAGDASYVRNQNVYTSSQLIEFYNDSRYFALTGMKVENNKQQRYIKLHVGSDNSFVIDGLDDNTVHILVSKITGIKFYRYIFGVPVDETLTSSGNGVPSTGAVYDALLNASGFGVSEIIKSKLTLNNFTCDSNYYSDTANSLLLSNWSYSEEAKLKNSIPCVSCQIGNNGGYGLATISTVPEGTEMYFKKKNGDSVTLSVDTGTIVASNGVTLYYAVTSDKLVGGSYSHDTVPSNRKIDGSFSSSLERAQALLTASQIVPSKYLIYDVDSTYLQEIKDAQILKYDNDMYYKCNIVPSSNHIYYYSLNTDSEIKFTVLDFDLSEETMTIIDDVGAKPSLVLDSVPTENSTNGITSGGVYTALAALEARIQALEGN